MMMNIVALNITDQNYLMRVVRGERSAKERKKNQKKIQMVIMMEVFRVCTKVRPWVINLRKDWDHNLQARMVKVIEEATIFNPQQILTIKEVYRLKKVHREQAMLDLQMTKVRTPMVRLVITQFTLKIHKIAVTVMMIVTQHIVEMVKTNKKADKRSL